MNEGFYAQSEDSKKKFAKRKQIKKLKIEADKIIKDIYSKPKRKKKYERLPQTRDKQQPPRSMTAVPPKTKKFKEGGICRGAGAAVKGTKFQGVF
tara:strand:- start:829 stop:1113 length:285 start_codon:yes stop_codon:yes gene_type:complete